MIEIVWESLDMEREHGREI